MPETIGIQSWSLLPIHRQFALKIWLCLKIESLIFPLLHHQLSIIPKFKQQFWRYLPFSDTSAISQISPRRSDQGTPRARYWDLGRSRSGPQSSHLELELIGHLMMIYLWNMVILGPIYIGDYCSHGTFLVHLEVIHGDFPVRKQVDY